MKREWKEIGRGDFRAQWAVFYVTMNSKGTIVMNRAAYERMDSPAAFLLLYDAPNNTIGLKPTGLKMRNAYPTGMKEVIGPSNEGFIINISIGPKNNLPMSRHNGIYSERTVSHPYWKERVYGYETSQGTIVVSVEEGLKMEKNRLRGIEEKIKEHLSQWASEQ